MANLEEERKCWKRLNDKLFCNIFIARNYVSFTIDEYFNIYGRKVNHFAIIYEFEINLIFFSRFSGNANSYNESEWVWTITIADWKHICRSSCTMPKKEWKKENMEIYDFRWKKFWLCLNKYYWDRNVPK